MSGGLRNTHRAGLGKAPIYAVVAIWVVSLLLGLTFWGVVIWAIIKVVSQL